MSRKWHRDRYTSSDGCVELVCSICKRHYWMPPSKVETHLRCSAECSAAYKEQVKQQRARDCETCGARFIPRTTQIAIGQGKFCSQKCNSSGGVASKAAVGTRLGEKSPKWRGGRRATYRRRVLKVVAYRAANAERLRKQMAAYQSAHPEVGKAIKARRRARKRSAGGTHTSADIRALMRLQKGKCPACRANITDKYHVDHIVPLAGGGTNDKYNLQLLCGPCNRNKHTKDPVRFMQERGYLL